MATLVSSSPPALDAPRLLVAAPAEGAVVVCDDGLSFWGGVDPVEGRIVDTYHPQCGTTLAGAVVLMPTSRGSCSGSGVLLELALHGKAPAALVFSEAEDVLTLGALVAMRMFDRGLAVVRLPAADYDRLAAEPTATVTASQLVAGDVVIDLAPLNLGPLEVSPADAARLAGADGDAVQLAMQVLCDVAAIQGASALLDVSRAHIDGCIYASPANLIFAERLADMGARVAIPTTMNAISVDRDNWERQNVPPELGVPASRLADAYVRMGAAPTFTCAPYQSDDAPALDEAIGWSESNAVIYANSVLGARTVKHPDFLDLFIALTGRAPHSGVYLDDHRHPDLIIDVDLPAEADDAVWALLGWLVGQRAPGQIPLLRGLAHHTPQADDLRAVCAAFGTTSASPMLHIDGVTPQSHLPPKPGARIETLSKADFRRAWDTFNAGPSRVELVALGSPHFSLAETRRFAALMAGATCHDGTTAIVTLSRATRTRAATEGLLDTLTAAGVQVITDLCWCSISEPVFPPAASTLMTNSGKYAHYGPALSGRSVRFGGLAACARAAQTGFADDRVPDWLT
ncbi:MAG: aconitase family protein [Pseudomonadota bacterium]